MTMNTNWVYKIMTVGQWERLCAGGYWSGAEVDLQDGFIHLSAWEQVPGTLEKHFAGQTDLLLIGIRSERIEADLKWEVSRGGQEFPHLYRELRLADVGNRREIVWDGQKSCIADELLDGEAEESFGGEESQTENSVDATSDLPLSYPLFLLHHGPGYVSLVDVASSADPQPQALALFSRYESAAGFVEQMAGFAGIKAIKNGRELQWLLTSLKAPVFEAVLDPAIDRPEIAGVWRRTIRELLDRYIELDNSPWNYPVYLLRPAGKGNGVGGGNVVDRSADPISVFDVGFSSIGAGTESQRFAFVVIFTSESLAEDYREVIEAEDGWQEIETMTDVRSLRECLVGLGGQIAGVAVNPTVEHGVRKCENCLEIGRLLDHYLVVVGPAGREI